MATEDRNGAMHDGAGKYAEKSGARPGGTLETVVDPGALRELSSESDESGSWPPEPTVTTHQVKGVLADRVRRRLGVHSRAKVVLTEETWYGGYSEWTSESGTEFTIAAGARRVAFYPDLGRELDWQEGAARVPAIRDTVFARFDTWLRAAEEPELMFEEWFELEAASASLTRYRAREDTTLWRSAADWSHLHGRIGSINLDYLEAEGRWLLDVVERANALGFRSIARRHMLASAAADQSREESVIRQLTDLLMPGTSSV